ncbi:MAG: TonB-dependent receptor [Gammaproteobacteria bacterium]|nr:TonB-dependent receptor [Gammaproteobacteria bacterium]
MSMQNKVVGGVAALLSALFLPASFAQSVDNEAGSSAEVLEEVVVTGIRKSLQQSHEIKRDAENLVDAISATDIGKFPDENLAESLQRITGVQITRSRGEGQSVTVRGLNPDFTRVQLNGRTAASVTARNIFDLTGGRRSFDFTSLASDFVSTLEVHKTPTADMEEGGIAATVDVRTARPLDIGRRSIAASVYGVYEENPDDIDPKFSVLYTDVLADDRAGFTVGFSRSERSVDAHEYEAFGVEPANQRFRDYFGDDLPAGAGFNHASNYGTNSGTRERINALAALQVRPTDNLELWFDGLYSEFDSSLQRAQNSHRFTNMNPARAGDPVGLVNSEISGGLATLIDADSVDHRNNNRREDTRDESYHLSFGGEWTPTDRLTAEAELSYSSAKRKSSELSLEVIGRASVVSAYDDPSGIPSISYTRGYDPFNADNFRAVGLNGRVGSTLEDENFDVRLDLDLDVDAGFLSTIEFGGKYSDRERERIKRDVGVGAEALAGLLGLQYDADVENGSFNAAPFMVEFNQSGFFGGADSAGSFPSRYLVSSSDLVLDQVPLSSLGSYISEDRAAGFNVQEEVLAGYLKANFEGADGRFSGNVGVRVVHTDLTSAGYGSDLGSLSRSIGGSRTIVGRTSEVSESRSYTEVLPSLNMRFELTDDVVARLGLARTMARPTLSQLSPAISSLDVRPGIQNIAMGNPGLKPFISDQIDVSLSWYFAESSRVSAAFFYKDIDDIIVSGQLDPITVMLTVEETGAREQYSVSPQAPVNSDSEVLKGFELSYEQAFTTLPSPFNGLGILANYTYVDKASDSQLDSVSKDNYNLTGYYEDDRLSVRLAYNYRSGYTFSFVNFFGDGAEIQEFGQLDMSAQYSITDNFDLVFEALNLTEETVVTLNDNGVNRGVEDVGIRLTFGLRANY